ncbi:spore protease YyaC [Sporosarcina sp. FSL W8-0480]|uniref:spore protease YyaC n=1 Tax=Sporosarcina sp. FSL W8-0480 TaxID=2954701 RepID=UPI0030DC0E4A
MHSALTTDYDFRIHYDATGAVWNLSSFFLKHIPFHMDSISFFCIGTDRSTGDALGPLTGSHLSESLLFPFSVIGTLEKPLHALNLQQQLDKTFEQDRSTFIVAIDACLGKNDSIGQLLLHNGPLYPGKAVGKALPPVGDLSIKGVVNVSGFMEQAVLQSTRLHLPFEMSRVISRSLQLAYGRFKTGNEQL